MKRGQPNTRGNSRNPDYYIRKIRSSDAKDRKLSQKSLEDSSEPKVKKSKWGSFGSKKSSQTISISTDSLKNWFPDFKLINEPTTPMELEPEEQALPVVEEKPKQLPLMNKNDSDLKPASTSAADDADDVDSQANQEDMAEQGPVSKMIFIQNLVRPFTLNQLKTLLKQNGNYVEESFWIDKIKSKCFVTYETEKEALKARNALNNTRWPSSNPKILTVEFSNEEELEQQKKGNEPPLKPVAEPLVEPPEIRDHSIEERRKERERRRERQKTQAPIREWDKDKVMQESPERLHVPKEEKQRSSEKKEKRESKKRPSEDTSAKLLDDLFQKTKNTPCIYWLPLTEEQVQQREDAEKMKKMEREKRYQHMKEQDESDRRSKRARSPRKSREKESRKSSTRSRSPITRRR